MILTGCLFCAGGAETNTPRTFMIGLYLVGFGLFAFILELKHVPGVIKWCPALETYFGKGIFFIFWGFLLFGGDVGTSILAVIFLGSGVAYMVAQFSIGAPPVHFMGDDKFQDTQAAEHLERYDRDNASASMPIDPYLSSVKNNNDTDL
ncbi:hypothetical protein CTAYLR_005213 [Chrysophaeum taylorii]|uniref:Uncharacterized protein n=1 Tax=Chrysophaeum taylorii TaxID=2483200 RepID=A0AAD7UAY2_9STRA|nr:hypothetical protein CTAYLR_005213 [Chrysophaeum taylorii]